MGAGEIKREGFNRMLAILCQLQIKLERARKDGKKKMTLAVDGGLHKAILKAVEIATIPPDKGEKDRRGAQSEDPTTEY